MFALVFKYFSGVLASVLGACFKCFIYLFFLLHLYVSKVDRVLHIGCAWEAASGAGDVRAAWGHCWCVCSRAQHARHFAPSLCRHRPDANALNGRPDASKSVLIVL